MLFLIKCSYGWECVRERISTMFSYGMEDFMAAQDLRDLMEEDGSIKENSLKNILNNTIDTIEENKSQIFNIYETARTEVEASRKLLEDIKKQTLQTIDAVDRLTKQEQEEKQLLVQVSSNFSNYSEEAIRASYETVKNTQVELGVAREKEKRLREQRDKLELRLRHLQVMLSQAEHLAMAIGSVLSYLSTQIGGVVWKIEAVQKEKFVGARIIKAQEDERYRISREIHDGPAQDLANLIFQTSVCEKLVDYDAEEAKSSIQDLRQQIRECLVSVRQVALDDLGLAAALHQLCSKMEERGMEKVDFSTDGEKYNLPKHVEIAVFRIVQEALNNVLHHAEAKKSRVRIYYAPAVVSILVEDNGSGFNVDALLDEKKMLEQSMEEPEQEGHFGLISMRERAKLIGAEFNISSSIGKGTKVHIRIPNRINSDFDKEVQKK